MFYSKFLGITFGTLVLVSLMSFSLALPSSWSQYTKRFDSGIDFIQLCLSNCAHCKKMFGDYFQSQNCAETCLKFKGKAIPDCEDINSISQFLGSLE